MQLGELRLKFWTYIAINLFYKVLSQWELENCLSIPPNNQVANLKTQTRNFKKNQVILALLTVEKLWRGLFIISVVID